MKIQIKILNKEFYRTGNLLLTNPPKDEYRLPQYATQGSAGVDLSCTEDVRIYPGETKMISTGLAIWIDSSRQRDQHDIQSWLSTIDTQVSIAGLIFPRSGLGAKGLVLANTVGVIDEDYQGELKIAAWNRLKSEKIELFEPCPDCIRGCNNRGCARCNYSHVIKTKGEEQNILELKAGDRIAQLVFVPIIKASWNIVEEFSDKTRRGTGGFNSTGEQ